MFSTLALYRNGWPIDEREYVGKRRRRMFSTLTLYRDGYSIDERENVGKRKHRMFLTQAFSDRAQCNGKNRWEHSL